MALYFDRYSDFSQNGNVTPIPGIKLTPKRTDKQVVYKKGFSRLDKFSQQYYRNPYHGFLILLANPEFGGLEFNIPDNSIIRIPFPFNETLEQYQREVDLYKKLYGE